jgi:hypothetical protein
VTAASSAATTASVTPRGGKLVAPVVRPRWEVSDAMAGRERRRRLESVPWLASVWIYLSSLAVIPCVVAVLLTSGLAHLVLLYAGGFLVVSSIVLASLLGRSSREERPPAQQPPAQQPPARLATVRVRSPGRYRRPSEGNVPACVVVLPVRVREEGTGPNHLA